MIVHIITGLERGGAEGALFRLLTVAPDPAKVRVVSLGGAGLYADRLRAIGIEVTCIQLHPSLPSPRKLLRLVRLLRSLRPALVQTWMYHADLIGGLAARLAGVPVCWGVRQTDLSPQRNKWSTLLVVRACAWLSRLIPARIVSCSQRAAEVHRSLGYRAPFVVIANGLDVSAWISRPEQRVAVRAQLGLADDAFVFAHAGRADPQKDHSALATAFSRVRTQSNTACLLLCGQGLVPGDPYFETLPFTDGAREHVLALGVRDDLPQLWQAADAFVLSSLGEAFPNVVAEAMACGLPCVVTDVGDAAEIVGDTGLVVAPADPQALAEGMRALLDLSSSERTRMGAQARDRVATRFTLARMAAGFRQVWDDVIAEEIG